MEAIRRIFFYGSQEADKNITWVKWSKVLAAKQFGGLGASSLFSLNRALLMRWVWRFIFHDNSFWCRFISAVHGPSFQVRYGTSLWRTITSEVNGLKAQGVDSLSHCLKRFWDMNGSGTYRVKDVRNMHDDFFLPKDEVATRWLPHLPIKLNVFAWRLYLDRLPTKSNLIRRGIQSLGLFVVGGMWCGCLVALTPSGFLGCCRLKWVPGLKVYMFPGGRFGCTEI
ncbi:hypothetical protein Tco_1281817 [Tanacetum coccineum]